VQRKKAIALQQDWGDRPCPHPAFAREYDLGERTGNYVCTQCGTTLTFRQKAEIVAARTPERPPAGTPERTLARAPERPPERPAARTPERPAERRPERTRDRPSERPPERRPDRARGRGPDRASDAAPKRGSPPRGPRPR
jgi:hypothetical protein